MMEDKEREEEVLELKKDLLGSCTSLGDMMHQLEKVKQADSSTYEHKEAFCLMEYTCESCGMQETLWNSRDGVTPFIISCAKCKGKMQHSNWNNDRRDPFYRPPKGSRIFIDLTPQMEKFYSAMKVVHWWDDGQYPMSERYGSPKEAFDIMVGDDSQPEGQPDVMVVPF